MESNKDLARDLGNIGVDLQKKIEDLEKKLVEKELKIKEQEDIINHKNQMIETLENENINYRRYADEKAQECADLDQEFRTYLIRSTSSMDRLRELLRIEVNRNNY